MNTVARRSRQMAASLFVIGALAVAVAVDSVRADNIAPQGTGIIGVDTAIGTDLGTPLAHAGTPSALNDNDLTTHVDTFDGAGGPTVSYAGILFPTPRADVVHSISINIAAFFDGGWFGPNNSGPGASGMLTPNFLTSPTVQVTLNGGTTWLNVASTDDYVSKLQGTMLPVAFGPPSTPPTATFTLTVPQTGITGIRLIGTEGGTASGGFLGAFEVGVDASVPEPASLGLIAVVTPLLVRRRRIR